MKKPSYTVNQALIETLFDPLNMEIVRLLAEEPVTVSEIASQLSLEDPAAVEQLETLVNVGVAKRTDTDQGASYSLTHANFATITDLMDEVMKGTTRDDLSPMSGELEPDNKQKLEVTEI